MKLEKGEYTIQSLIEYLTKKHGEKLTGKSFTQSDIHAYIKRGYLPFRYGGQKITMKVVEGVKIITFVK